MVKGRNKIQDVWNPRLFKVIQVPSPQSRNHIYKLQPDDCDPNNPSYKVVHRENLRVCVPQPEHEIPDIDITTLVHNDSSDGSDTSDAEWVVHFTLGSRHQQCITGDYQTDAEDVQLPTDQEVQLADLHHGDVTDHDEDPPLRRSTRRTAGQHPNPHRFPRSAAVNCTVVDLGHF